jgi:hypothetical protein
MPDLQIEFLWISYEKEKPMPLIFEQVKLDCGYRLDILVRTRLLLR